MLITSLTNGTWRDSYLSPVNLNNLSFVSFCSNCNEYWNAHSKQFDVAGVLSDLGTAELADERLDAAQRTLQYVLSLTKDDPSSQWHVHAESELREVAARRKEGH